MKRRRILVASAAALVLPALGALAQRPPRKIGWLAPTSDAGLAAVHRETFIARLRELGYADGRDFVLEARHGGGRDEKLPALAREIIASEPAVIVTFGSAAIAALRKETGTLPIVFATAIDVVEQGFVKSIARPGGNVTGVTLRTESLPKLLELIRETQPATRRIALLEYEGDRMAGRSAESLRQPAQTLGVQVKAVRIGKDEHFERAFAEMARDRTDAVIVPPMAFFGTRFKAIADLAMKHKLPVYGNGRWVMEGGLLTYVSDTKENFRRTAAMVDKILKGAKPADIPVEQPDRFSLLVNLRTAKALKIAIPQSVLMRAEEVIE